MLKVLNFPLDKYSLLALLDLWDQTQVGHDPSKLTDLHKLLKYR